MERISTQHERSRALASIDRYSTVTGQYSRSTHVRVHSQTLPQQAPGQRQVQQTSAKTRQGAVRVGRTAYTADVRKPRFVSEAADWFHYLTWRQIFGYLFALAGIILTIVAVKVDPKNQLLIAIVAAFAQLMAATMFSRQGKADPTHAKRSVQRLIALARRTYTVETSAQESFEGSYTPTQRRDHMGQVSAQLGGIGEEIANAVFDWTAFNENLTDLLSDDERKNAERYTAALRAAESTSEEGQGQ